MRKMPAAPSLERVLPRHPLEIRDRLVPHENGCLLDPDFYGLAYCPVCWLSMHPSYFPRHDKRECEIIRMEDVREVMKS